MKDLNSLTWSEINDLIENLDFVDLAENLSYDNLKKLGDSYIVRHCLYNFKDRETIGAVINLSDYLYSEDKEDHSKIWHVDRLGKLINAGYDITILEERPKDELFSMVRNVRYYVERADDFVKYAKAKRQEQEQERER